MANEVVVPVNKHRKDEVRNFIFDIPLKAFIGEDGKIKTTPVEGLIVGDRDVIFDIVFTIVTVKNDDLLDIKLVRTSQRLSKVYVTKCRVFADNMESLSFRTATLVAGNETTKRSSVTLRDCWSVEDLDDIRITEHDDDEIICIAGTISYKPPSVSLQGDLKLLINDKETSDVEIRVGDVSFASHKCLLSVRSSVFRAMFNSNLKESIENVVKLSDDDPDVFEQALHFMYTDKCPKISTMVLDLLVLADKYHIKGLILHCHEEMMKTMNTENVCDYIVKSAMIQSKKIYSRCLNYFNSKKSEIVKTDGWKRLKETNSNFKITSDIIEKISNA